MNLVAISDRSNDYVEDPSYYIDAVTAGMVVGTAAAAAIGGVVVGVGCSHASTM